MTIKSEVKKVFQTTDGNIFEDKDKAEEHQKQIVRMSQVIGRKIENIEYDPSGEGTYTLLLSGGLRLTFTSSGDDMNYTMMNIDHTYPRVPHK